MTTTSWLCDPQYDAALDELAALQVTQAAAFAAQARVLARLAARTTRDGWQGEAPFDSLVLDVAGTCHLGQLAASSRLTDGEHLVVRLPATLDALETGQLLVHQAQVLIGETRSLEPAVCAEVERRILPVAPELCPADLKRLVRKVVLEVDAAAAARREAEAVRGRRVWVRPAEDGMGLLCALLPAEQAQQVQAQLTERARQARADGDPRSADQLRADLLVALTTELDDPADALATGEQRRGPRRRRPRGRPVRVVVHVPLAVALGLSDAPAELEGYGPVSASHARRLAASAELVRACVAQDGSVWAVEDDAPLRLQPDQPRRGRQPDEALRDRLSLHSALLRLADRPPPEPLPPEKQHDPSAPLARLVRTRDARCDGPGCSCPAARCELDHDVPWPDGETSAGNVVARSQRCHHAKHAGWTAERTGEGTVWTSPGGRRYVVPSRRASAVPGPARSRREHRARALAAAGYQLVAAVELDGGLSAGDGLQAEDVVGATPARALGLDPASVGRAARVPHTAPDDPPPF